MKQTDGFRFYEYCALMAVTIITVVICICVGSVVTTPRDTVIAILDAVMGRSDQAGSAGIIIINIRLPRVLCALLVGGSLSVCGCAMQGLLRNPLADGSTLGVSSAASLGAVIAIAFGISIPGLPIAGTMALAIIFAFISMLLIITFAYRMDRSLSTNTIILIGVVFSMFANSVTSLIIAFAGERIKPITFWMMGSLAGSNYSNTYILAIALLICGGIIFKCSRELNAFAIGEDNASHIGVDVKKIRLIVLITVSALIGVCVSIGGTIGFAGLVVPHMARMVVGPNHRKLIPASLFSGAIFLAYMDLASRVVLRPLELPIGVVTSLIGSFTFIFIFYKSRRAK